MSVFIQALQQATAPLIAEIKPFSPECGDLLRGRSPVDIARHYVAQGAACLSVTTGHWHQGSLSLLQQIAEVVPVPILRKDFIIRTAQLSESREAGAAAVLLSAQLLRRQELLQLTEQALVQGLTPFIEASDAAQLDGLRLPIGSVLAVCNRDIRQQEKDDGTIEHSLALYSLARTCGAELLVSASAMRRPQDAVHVIDAGYDAVLIGSALLMKQDGVEQTTALFISALTLYKKGFK